MRKNSRTYQGNTGGATVDVVVPPADTSNPVDSVAGMMVIEQIFQGESPHNTDFPPRIKAQLNGHKAIYIHRDLAALPRIRELEDKISRAASLTASYEKDILLLECENDMQLGALLKYRKAGVIARIAAVFTGNHI